MLKSFGDCGDDVTDAVATMPSKQFMESVEKPRRGDEGFSSRVPSVTWSFDQSPQAVVEDVVEEEPPFESKVKDPKAAFAEAVAKIDPSDLEASLVEAAETPLELHKLHNFLDCLSDVLPGVSFEWNDIFKEPVWSKLFYDVIDVSDIPQPVYKVSAEYIDELEEDTLCDFLCSTFDDIMKCHLEGDTTTSKFRSNVSVLVGSAILLRCSSYALSSTLDYLRDLQLDYERKGVLTSPFTVWMIAQASQDDLPTGLESWAVLALPLFQSSNEQSKDLILKLVENLHARVSENPDVWTQLVHLFPPTSTLLLLQHTFPPPPAGEEETTRRLKRIYPFLKKVALAGVQYHPAHIAKIFDFCLRSTGIQGNPDLAKEATEIAIWTLTKSIACWDQWDDIYKENLKTSVALLKKIAEKWEDHSPQLLLPRDMLRRQFWKKISKIQKAFFREAGTSYDWEMARDLKSAMEEAVNKAKEAVKREMEEQVKIKQVKIFTQKIFKFSLRLLAGSQGNPDLAKEATEVAMWSLTKNVHWWNWNLWEHLYKENVEASVAIFKTIVEKWKEDHSLKLPLSWALDHTLAGAQPMEQVTKNIFTFALRLSGQGNPDLAKEATELAIWSLTECVDCWKHWSHIYNKNPEASVTLLKKLVEKCNGRSLKLSSSSSPFEDMEQLITQKMYTISLIILAEEGNPDLAKEAREIAIWSLTKKDELDKKKLEAAAVALLKRPVATWEDHYLELLSSLSDDTLSRRTIKSFRLKKKRAITEGGEANGSLYKEADKRCKVISGRLSRGTSLVLVIACLVLVIALALLALNPTLSPTAKDGLYNLTQDCF